MKKIKLALWALLFVLSALWFMADTLWPQPFGYFPLRRALVQYTGVLAIGVMSVGMVLATRPRWLEPHLGGLDKMYRLHKWLGISALTVSVVHWWMAKGTKWMVGWGWLTRPARQAGKAPELAGVEAWLRQLRDLAEGLGEWAFYGAVALIALALIKRFPYHLFVKTHKWLAVAYLVLAFHTVVLAQYAYWSQPVGWVLALLVAAGTVSAALVLFKRVGAHRKAAGRIDTLTYYPTLQVLETAIQMEGAWAGHRAGQFAFVTSNPREGAHPYTIASAWDPALRRIVFITKALGDHTRRLHERLKPGLPVVVEGPYGCFDFEDPKPVQIWVGAGIGITPFIARMKQLAGQPHTQQIHLFHPTSDFDERAIDKLTADALAAGVQLHVLHSRRDGRLDAERIRQAVPKWKQASLWFCGPSPFGAALRDAFVSRGPIKASDFHQEVFEMR